MSSSATPRVRSLYRSLLRELPPRPGRPASELQSWAREKIVVGSRYQAPSAPAEIYFPITSPVTSTFSPVASSADSPRQQQHQKPQQRQYQQQEDEGEGEEGLAAAEAAAAQASTPTSSSSSSHPSSSSSLPPRPREDLALAEQAMAYLRAQRTHSFLLDRYNPGASEDEGERVRLSARRVGMNMPNQFEER